MLLLNFNHLGFIVNLPNCFFIEVLNSVLNHRKVVEALLVLQVCQRRKLWSLISGPSNNFLCSSSYLNWSWLGYIFVIPRIISTINNCLRLFVLWKIDFKLRLWLFWTFLVSFLQNFQSLLLWMQSRSSLFFFLKRLQVSSCCLIVRSSWQRRGCLKSKLCGSSCTDRWFQSVPDIQIMFGWVNQCKRLLLIDVSCCGSLFNIWQVLFL